MGLRIVLLAVAVITVECVNREKLKSTPRPQKAFSVDKYVGDWYLQARLPPCSWAGSSEFTNFVCQYSKQPSGNIHMKDTWRSGVCGSAIMDLTLLTPSGVYILKDPIGNVLSGKYIVVATDYNTFSLIWGCTKYFCEVCTDSYVTVKTRQREPSAFTLQMIEKLMDQFWQLKLDEMVRVSHDKDNCVTFSPHKDPYGAPQSVQHLMKTY